MKKILTIALALVLVLAAVPAMAFTGTTNANSAITPKLSIYLVDYSDSGFFGLTTLPAADRGYAKNEIVAAVVELLVPAGATTTAYNTLTLTGTNVSLNVTDNNGGVIRSINPTLPTPLGTTAFTLNASDNTLKLAANGLLGTASTSAQTFKYLYFAKVTADSAKMTAILTDGSGVGTFVQGDGETYMNLVLSGITYHVGKNYDPATGGTYRIHVNDGTAYPHALITLSIDSSYKTIGMTIDPKDTAAGSGSDPYALGVTVGGVLGIVKGATVVTSSTDADYTAIMAVYNDVVKGVFGLDYFKIGNYLYDSFFTGFTSANTITVSVDIKPWTAYVTVPQTPIVNPPKTGDAAGIMGFVMIALAVAAAAVVRKVRA